MITTQRTKTHHSHRFSLPPVLASGSTSVIHRGITVDSQRPVVQSHLLVTHKLCGGPLVARQVFTATPRVHKFISIVYVFFESSGEHDGEGAFFSSAMNTSHWR